MIFQSIGGQDIKKRWKKLTTAKDIGNIYVPVSAIKSRASSVGNPHTAGLGWREDKISNWKRNREVTEQFVTCKHFKFMKIISSG